MSEHTPTPWETSKHDRHQTIGTPKGWRYVQHNFPNAPYEGELEDEYGIYPPLGESGPVALVAGASNAAFFVRACNAHDALVDALKHVAKFLEVNDEIKWTPERYAVVMQPVRDALKLAGAK